VDDPQRTNTETISNVIETIHVFVDCLSGIVDAWEMFSRSEIMLFTRHAPEKLTWPEILARITRNMSEVERLRKLLITKRERFKFKLESVSDSLIRCRIFSSQGYERMHHTAMELVGVLVTRIAEFP
jgi:hypothetical protein